MSSHRSSVRFGVPTFLGAALLFVVQPMLAKWLLPAVGGSPATWAACLLFFQALLLASYAYARWLSGLPLRHQALVHLGLVAAAALSVVMAPVGGEPQLGGGAEALAIVLVLLRRVGLPCLLLGSSTPLFSSWAARALGGEAHGLYALSNAGSLLGLAAHPFLLELTLELGAELTLWAWAFWLFCALSALTLALVWRANPGAVAEATRAGETPSAGQRARWLALAFVPSVMLLASTHHVTVDIAPMPLLWVVPLALYLASFVVAFSAWRPSWRAPFLVAWLAGAAALGLHAFAQASISLASQLAGTLLALVASCTLCHGELARARPDPRWLTQYYLIIATGGALGGVSVSLLAPLVFSDYYELELGAALTFLVLLFTAKAPAAAPWSRTQRLILVLGTALALPVLGAGVFVRASPETRQGRVVERSRSFLGPLRVVQVPAGRVLTHGNIQHGLQLGDPALRRAATLYFGPGTGVARVLGQGQGPRRIGVIGLGVGTLATYGHAGDELTFYELDPRVLDIARRDFTFLADSPARVSTVLGDARLSLSREAPHGFDVLVLDAFSSDSIPVHLLTREAFAQYARHLAPGGVLLAHISNRFLRLDRVVRGGARANGLACAILETPTDRPRHVSHAVWALMSRDPAELSRLGVTDAAATGPEVTWTDAHASLVPVLRWSK